MFDILFLNNCKWSLLNYEVKRQPETWIYSLFYRWFHWDDGDMADDNGQHGDSGCRQLGLLPSRTHLQISLPVLLFRQIEEKERPQLVISTNTPDIPFRVSVTIFIAIWTPFFSLFHNPDLNPVFLGSTYSMESGRSDLKHRIHFSLKSFMFWRKWDMEC